MDGMGGSGKTSLAVHAAHRLAGDYPDGQLYIDLRGYTPGEKPVSASGTLHSLLRALGVPGDAHPGGSHGPYRPVAGDDPREAAAAPARQRGRRDGGPAAAALRRPGCLVLVTSRARLVDLDSAQWISIDVMTPRGVRGTGRARPWASSGATRSRRRRPNWPGSAAICRWPCGSPPPGCATGPAGRCSYLADRLRDETRRLDELSSGAAQRRRHPAPVVPGAGPGVPDRVPHPGAASGRRPRRARGRQRCSGRDPRDAEDLLELLLDVHLLQQPEIGLYMFHDLVRSFAQSLSVDGDQGRRLGVGAPAARLLPGGDGVGMPGDLPGPAPYRLRDDRGGRDGWCGRREGVTATVRGQR